MFLVGFVVGLLIVLFIRRLFIHPHRVEELIDGVFKYRTKDRLFMRDKKAWFCHFEKPCVKCRARLANGEHPIKVWPPGSSGCGEMVPLKARLLMPERFPGQWDAVRMVVGRNIFGTIISYEFGPSYDPEMLEKSRKLKARLADTGIDAATGKLKLYDLSKDDYPLKAGVVVRTQHAATCAVCGAYTNKATVTSPFEHSMYPGAALSFRCPQTDMAWHKLCAQMDSEGDLLHSEIVQLRGFLEEEGRERPVDPEQAKNLDNALKEAQDRLNELESELAEIETQRRELFDAHRFGIINDIVGDAVPAKYYRDAY